MTDPTTTPEPGPAPVPAEPVDDGPSFPVETLMELPGGRVLRTVQESEGARPLFYLTPPGGVEQLVEVAADVHDLIAEVNAL